jgi:hypothetical protein
LEGDIKNLRDLVVTLDMPQVNKALQQAVRYMKVEIQRRGL